MKRMFLGSMLFICGFIGVLLLVVISIYKPWNYNGIEGFKGFLLGTHTGMFFGIFCSLSILGLVICSIEAYRKSSIKD